MPTKNYNILLIEDNPGDVRLIQEMLKEVEGVKFNFRHADRLSKALEILIRNGIDVVLLDLSLPDSQGLETFNKLQERIPDIAVIVLTGLDDSTIGVKAVQQGAQDYLIKGKVDGQLLFRSICYAIERHHMMKRLKELATTDELTGLYNRRGFLTYGKELLKLAKRMERAIFLLYVDLDRMKWINDNFGHQEGDKALQEISNILRKNFRKSDVIARIGGDEFVVLGLVTSWRGEKTLSEILIGRLEEKLNAFNLKSSLPYKLSISAGLVAFDSSSIKNIDELLEEADKLMYEHKRRKQRSSKIK
ncbi:GGDEF domain-containing response regulator [Candidatus Aminicenantes bacterium AC-708-M15]|jgi:diguanylate cyclase (GGDEF)-like protein|nr:GGDEF domain-containing response regulator [SCandidatus Aminicenantes bacterium Aminicenantia_JdfR_composite]MCP2598814.1 GGDEF domain-containing response regulator [Candidatus Aminicenantes bacterium AC-335-L06]MCP2604483.1 GGDEF domain-containing response regulator [Candidatus Aminicenantes bacterium AC-708-M15]MCP2606548.1 GGDEF domain-containing response regulator [Candidatus Aminicenantes bacterium AC-708-I09]MCP2618902.1 GGDEF domain-containing response regulator [Candidatus Aminicenan